MTDAEKIAMVKKLCDETDEATISAYLFMAGRQVIALCCEDGETTVPPKWDAFHIDATVYKLNKRGAEGETNHNENGINRAYESADLPTSMLMRYGVVGKCQVVS